VQSRRSRTCTLAGQQIAGKFAKLANRELIQPISEGFPTDQGSITPLFGRSGIHQGISAEIE
jgi:hypothetical protein